LKRAFRLVAFFAAGLLGVGCAGAPPPSADPAPELAKSELTPKSAEWLYATDGVAGGLAAECRVVPERLEREMRCQHALCRHGAALAKDWLASCRESAPERASSVEQRGAELTKRASRTPAPCEAEIADLVRDGCGERKDCREFVQSWATRCAEYSTPLVLRILEVAVERQAGEHVGIDGRSCGELFEPVSKAQSCDHEFKCQDSLDALETYRERCEPKGKPVDLAVAVVEASLLAGAAQNVPPIGLVPGAAALEPKVTPLPLDDGSGAVLSTCGKRAPDVASYLSARASCSEELVIARRFQEPNGPVLRVGHLPHGDDATFRKRFPSLAARGELAARYEAALPAFARDVDAAIELSRDRKQTQAAILGLVATLVRHLDPVRNSKAFDVAIRERDLGLVPLFQAIGRAKKKALHPDLAERKLAAALHRAEAHALADVGSDGKVRIGELTVASSLELEDMLPKASAAYREELSSRLARLPKLDRSNKTLDKLSAEAATRVDRCGEAAKRAKAAESALIACAFGEKACAGARTTSLGAELDAARQDVEAQYLATALAISSLPEERREPLESRADRAGCSEP
jgi:hypothetical protein